MAKKGKKLLAAKAKVDVLKKYPLAEAVALAKETSYSSFTGSLEVHVKTNANPKYNDQVIRATVSLPHGTGKQIRIAAFVSPENNELAKQAWADLVGKEELLADIQAGNIAFDVLVTTADMMRDLARVAKVLWPKGLMPSPKAWTVTTDIAKTVDELKKWRVEFKLDKTGNIHVLTGNLSFSDDQLIENVETLLKALVDNRPSGVKGKLIKKVSICATMWPGIAVDRTD